jgi:NAD(P)-dependent dehydrogenase (short-subunit alcohol dehydrogenase family)
MSNARTPIAAEDLKGRTAIVTGGAGGIGRGTVLALAALGVNVVIADLDVAGGEETARAAEALGAGALNMKFDAAYGSYDALRDQCLERFGRIDIVMNNVGVLTNGLPENIPIEEWQRIIDTNLLSVVRSNHTFLPLMIAQRSGHIVNTASFAGLFTYAFDRTPYAACKAAVIQLSEGLAIYLRPMGIGVTVLCPGPVKTNIAASVRSFGPRADLRTPGPQFSLLEPEAVGEMVVDAILHNKFMVPTHENVREILVSRAENWDAYLQRQIDEPHIYIPGGKPA